MEEEKKAYKEKESEKKKKKGFTTIIQIAKIYIFSAYSPQSFHTKFR